MGRSIFRSRRKDATGLRLRWRIAPATVLVLFFAEISPIVERTFEPILRRVHPTSIFSDIVKGGPPGAAGDGFLVEQRGAPLRPPLPPLAAAVKPRRPATGRTPPEESKGGPPGPRHRASGAAARRHEHDYNQVVVGAPPMFDVYLTGARDGSPSVHLRLTTEIAIRYRLAAPMVAEALEGIPCRIKARVTEQEAEALVVALTSMGATARLSRSRVSGEVSSGMGAPSDALPARISSPAPRGDSTAAPAPSDGRITLKSADVEVPAVVEVSEPIDFAEPGTSAGTGVRGPDTFRCTIHGLAYDRRRASGCLKCLAAARARVRKLQEESGGRLTRAPSPVELAFWGLAVSLAVGFLPAAYYARQSNRIDLLALRARQTELSTRAATQESLARFDALDGAVEATYRLGAGRTLLIWIGTSGTVGTIWWLVMRTTRRRRG